MDRLRELQDLAANLDIPEFCSSAVVRYLDGYQLKISYSRDRKQYFCCVHIPDDRRDIRNVAAEFDAAVRVMEDAIDRGLPLTPEEAARLLQ